jgi:hypothetical protein
MHGFLALVLLLAGFVFTAIYCTNPFGAGAAGKKGGKPSLASALTIEVPTAIAASVFLGVGTVFLFLWAGIFV